MAAKQTGAKIRVSRPRLFSVQEFERLVETGILAEDERVELIDGEVIAMTSIGARHATAVNRLNRLLGNLSAANQVFVSVQNPIRLNDFSEPQPDLILARVRSDDYAAGHPTPPDILLVVEVMDSTQAYDRQVKLPLYAQAGIVETWFVDLDSETIEACQEANAEGYRVRRIHVGEDRLSPAALPDFVVRVSDVVPDVRK